MSLPISAYVILCALADHFYESALQRQDVIRSLHATAKSEAWVECQNRIHRELSMRNSNSSITVLPRVLEKIPVMLFAGDQDYICNYVGQENMIQALTWNGATGLGVRSGRITDLFGN